MRGQREEGSSWPRDFIALVAQLRMVNHARATRRRREFVAARLYRAWFTILNCATSAIKSRGYEQNFQVI
jgi:hypothetical protein